MTPLTPDEIERAARLMQDTIVSTEKVRDGLRDVLDPRLRGR